MKEILTALLCCISFIAAIGNLFFSMMFFFTGRYEDAAILIMLSYILYYAVGELYKYIEHIEIY